MNLGYRITNRYIWDPTDPNTTIQIEAEVYDIDSGVVLGPPMSASGSAAGFGVDGGVQQLCEAIELQAHDRIDSYDNPVVSTNLGIIEKYADVIDVPLTKDVDIRKGGFEAIAGAKAALDVKAVDVAEPVAKKR